MADDLDAELDSFLRAPPADEEQGLDVHAPNVGSLELAFRAGFAVPGNTYPVKDELRALGCKWYAEKRVWVAMNRTMHGDALRLLAKYKGNNPAALMPAMQVHKKRHKKARMTVGGNVIPVTDADVEIAFDVESMLPKETPGLDLSRVPLDELIAEVERRVAETQQNQAEIETAFDFFKEEEP